MIKYSIIVPVYQGEKTLDKLVESILSAFSQEEQSYEIIFVYDCGKDKSWDVLTMLKKKYPEIIKLIKLSRNYGQHNALICGFEYASGEFIITMDEDLQHDPADAFKLVKEQQKGDYDVVYGKYDTRKHSFYRNITSQMMKELIRKGIPDLHSDYSAFRLIKIDTAKATIDMRNSYTFIDGYLSWVTQSFSSCIVSHKERYGGKSSYTFSKLLEHSINIFVTFSNYPIRLLTKCSIILFVISFVYAVYVMINKLVYDSYVAGYATFVIMGGMGISLILIALGILGEYIYRINLKTTRKPNYNVKDII